MDKESSQKLADALRPNKLLDATKDVDKKNPDNQIGHKEFKAMQKNNYADISKKFTASYVIQNKRTKQIVEVKASSVFHAANIVGWRPRHAKLIQVNDSSED